MDQYDYNINFRIFSKIADEWKRRLGKTVRSMKVAQNWVLSRLGYPNTGFDKKKFP